MKDLLLVPLAGTPQLEQSGARWTKDPTGICSIVQRTNLSSMAITRVLLGLELGWRDMNLDWGQPSGRRAEIHCTFMEITVIGGNSVARLMPQIHT